jgi:hypothetical protein
VVKKEKAIEAEEKRQARKERELANLAYYAADPRSSTRLRNTKTTNYVFDNEVSDEETQESEVIQEEERDTQDFVPDDEKKLADVGSEDDEEAFEEEDLADGRRRSSRNKSKSLSSDGDYGQRRSTRLRSATLDYADAQDDSESEELSELESEDEATGAEGAITRSSSPVEDAAAGKTNGVVEKVGQKEEEEVVPDSEAEMDVDA